MPRSKREWLDYIESLRPNKVELGLERVNTVARRCALKHWSIPVILVGGTNGKGSCISLLETIYTQAGYRVGAYTSPHLTDFSERIRLLEQPVKEAILCGAFEHIEKFREESNLTFFEFTTLAALQIFKNTPLDILFLEVGLGGRLDAVNIIEPTASIITSIALDHAEYLGNTRLSVGREKIGIFREGRLSIIGEPNLPDGLEKEIQAISPRLCRIGQDFKYLPLKNTWQWSHKTKKYQSLPLPALKLQNAATSLALVESLQEQLPVYEEAIRRGLEKGKLAGRVECFSTPMPTVLDVAHNPASAAWLLQQVETKYPTLKKIGVVGILQDKDLSGMLLPMLSKFAFWLPCNLSTERGVAAEDIADYLIENDAQAFPQKSVLDGVHYAWNLPEREAYCLIIFGSFYTVSECRFLYMKEK